MLSILATLIVIGLTPLTAAAAPAHSASSISDSGYTDKTALKEEGRTTGKQGYMSVNGQPSKAPKGTTYYVDSMLGDDSKDGKSPATAWKSLGKPNTVRLSPGDQLLFKAGSVWRANGTTTAKEAYAFTQWSGDTPKDMLGEAGGSSSALLAPKGSGNNEHPIILSSYGEGKAPKFEGRGVVNDVLQLTNQQYWDISNLDISNAKEGFDPTHFTAASGNGQVPGTENPDTGDLRGVHVQAESAGTIEGLAIHNMFIHDVAGVTWSVSKAGVDRSKRTGGLVLEGLKGDANHGSRFQNVRIQHNQIIDTAFANIVFKQFSGMGTARYQDKKPGWGDRAKASVDTNGNLHEDPDWLPHSNISISENYLSNRNTQYGWDAVYLTSVRAANVDGNVIDGAGVSGIELYWDDNIIVENNDVGELTNRTGAADSNGIDADRGTSNILIQHNYVHDSGEGFLLCGFSFSTAVLRYNFVANVERNYINPHGDSGVNIVYNNLFDNTRNPGPANSDKKVHFFASSGDPSRIYSQKNIHIVFNNIFLNLQKGTSGSLFQDGWPGVTFTNNAYYGPDLVPPATDPNAVNSDPKLQGDPLQNIANIAVATAASPLIATGHPFDIAASAPGMHVSGIGTTDQMSSLYDIFGRKITDRPDIGPAMYVPQQDKGLIVGTVTDAEGQPVSQAQVNQNSTTVTTNGHGQYALELTAGTYELRATKTGYQAGSWQKISPIIGGRTTVDLKLGPLSTTMGSLTGKVTSGADPIAGASISLAATDGKIVAQGETGNDGIYTLSNVPAGTGYRVTVHKSGFETASKEGIHIQAAQTSKIDFNLKPHYSYQTILDEDFNHEQDGIFQSTMDGVLTSNNIGDSGTISVEEDREQTGNKYLRLNKTSSSRGSLAVFNANPLHLSGVVTMEARVRRTTSNPAPNQAALYAYNAADWNGKDPTASTNPTATFGFSNSDIITHATRGSSKTTTVKPYQANQWYTIRNVADYDSGTFSLYVDDMNTPVLKDRPLRTIPADKAMDYCSLYINGTNKGDWMIDYLRIGLGEPMHTDITSIDTLQVTAEEETLEPDIKGETYTATFRNPFLTEATVKVTPTDPLASVSIDNQSAPRSQTIKLTESAPDQEATIITKTIITVTARNGKTAQYQLVLIRPNPSQTTYLQNLELKGIKFLHQFNYENQGAENALEPDRILDYGVDKVTIEWERGWKQQTVEINGIKIVGNNATLPITPGLNTIAITTDSFTGESGTYVIKIRRQNEQNSQISGDNSNSQIQQTKPQNNSQKVTKTAKARQPGSRDQSMPNTGTELSIVFLAAAAASACGLALILLKKRGALRSSNKMKK